MYDPAVPTGGGGGGDRGEGSAKELRGEVLRENRINHVVSGDPERFARGRTPRMFHVKKTLTPAAVEGNTMSRQRRRNPVRSVATGAGRAVEFAVTQSAAGQTAPTWRSSNSKGVNIDANSIQSLRQVIGQKIFSQQLFLLDVSLVRSKLFQCHSSN